MALKVGELFASFNLDTSGIGDAISSAESKMSSMGKSLAIGGAAMTAAVTAPIMKAASAIYSAGTDFDAEMSKVFAISQTDNAETMEALRSKALEMGSTTQFTATEAGEAFEYMAMAGWKSEQMLSAIEPILNLAAAAGADLGTTSDIVTDAMTAFGLSADKNWQKFENGQYIDTGINNVEHFADVLAAASSNANTNVTMLGESFKYAAPVAGTLGIGVEDTAIALGLMANAGIKASQAGTSLRTGLTNMVKPSKQMREAMEKYGIGLVENADGTVNLRETMIQMRKTMSGMTETEQAAAATAIFGKHSMAGWLAIVNASDEDFNKLTGAIDGATGSAEKMKETMLDNAKGDVTIFKSAVEGLEITLWGLAEGGFRKVVQEATKFVDTFRKASKSTQVGTLKMLGMAAALGPVMTGLGGIIALLPKLARTFTIVSGPAALLSIGLLALGAAAIDSNNDIGRTFVRGMASAGMQMRKFGANVKKQLPQLTANMGRFLESLSTGIKTGLPGIITGLSDVITTGVTAIATNMPKIANVSKAIVTTIASSIKRNAPKIVPAVLDLMTKMAAALITNIPVVLAGMSTVITSLIKEVQNADWSEIATELRTALEGAIKETSTLFKKLAMGDQYTEKATWSDVGTALVGNLMDGIKTGFGNLKDFVGSLLLGESYDPDEDFATFGTKIIDKVFEGIDDAADGASSFVSGILDGLADVFSAANISSATTALSTIASRIISGVADEIPKLAGHATTILEKLSELLIGDESGNGVAASATEGASKLAGSIITAIAGAIPSALDAAGNVISAGLTLGTKLLESISSAFDSGGMDLNVQGIVQSLIDNIVKVLGGVIDFGNGAVTAGTQIVTNLLDTIISAFDGVNVEGNMSGIGEKVRTLAQNIITSIVTILPKAFTAGGKVISAGVKLASELMTSLVEGFTGGDLTGGKDIVDGIVTAITGALKDAKAIGSQVLTAGAQIAKSIMTSIADSLKNAATSGVGESLGTAAVSLIHGLLSDITAMDGEASSFITNLGTSIMNAMGALGTIVGGFVGKLIGYLFSEEGLHSIYNAGMTILDLMLKGMAAGLAGVTNFIGNVVDNILIQLGIVDPEARAAANQSGTQLAAAIAAGAETEMANSELGKNMLAMMQYALYKGGQGTKGSVELPFEIDVSTLNGMLDTAGKTVEEFRDDFINQYLNSKGMAGSEGFEEFWKSLFPEEFEGAQTVEEFYDGIERLLEGYDSVAEMLRDKFGDETFFSGNMDFWSSLYKALESGDNTALMNLLMQQGSELFGVTADEAEKREKDAEKAVTEAKENLGLTTQKAAEETKANMDNFTQTLDSGANGLALDGITTTINATTESVSGAAASVSDAAVQQFLLTMSAENGAAIGTNFTNGIINAVTVTGGLLINATGVMAASAHNAAQAAMSYASAFRIGKNFGQGLVNGINAMIGAVADAAAAMGTAAGDALSGSIDEGSPSRLTAQSGVNFGLGFINAVLGSAAAAGQAAALMGVTASDALAKGASELSGMAADQMSLSGRNSFSETRAAENERNAQALGNVIASALNGARVEMNGVLVGELVTETVSEGIANRYAGMRYGTV